MNTYYIWMLLFVCRGIASGQSYEEIKKRPDIYLFGEGKDKVFEKAKLTALHELNSQISIKVESSFDYAHIGEGKNFNEKVQIIIKTYSSATLNNVEQLTISPEPNAHVFLYIKKSEVAKIFKSRGDKIINNLMQAEALEGNAQIGDALRLSYWALLLLKSHPDCSSMKYLPKNKKDSVVILHWIPTYMNTLFDNITAEVTNTEGTPEEKQLEIQFLYKKQNITNMGFTFFDGKKTSELMYCKDGVGLIELIGANAEPNNISLKIEYIYNTEARIDKELENILEQIDPIPFQRATIRLIFTQTHRQPKEIENKSIVNTSSSIKPIDVAACQENIKIILKSIREKNTDILEKYFTPEGWEEFQKLIKMGHAKVLSPVNQKITIEGLNNKAIVRPIKMLFSFQNNTRKFVEDVVFIINPDKKIENINIGLNEIAIKSIEKNKTWQRYEQLSLIYAMESYKTAFFLKNIDYLKNVFDDNALIIIGRVLKKIQAEPGIKQPDIIKKNRISKEEYIRNVSRAFASSEFINIHFETSEVEKGGKGNAVYGILIRQNYYSSSYGDKGHLFLVIDLNNIEKPIIKVRTWQPLEDKTKPFSIGDF